MTCIVGLQQEGKIWIGGDSAGVANLDIRIRADSKVFKVGEFGFGFTSSFRMGQLIRFSFLPPEQKSENDYQYLCTDFVESLRKCFKDGGYCKVKDGVEEGGHFLVGYRGRLYIVQSDFQVGIPVLEYDACGCGANYALGSLFATSGLTTDPKQRLEMALEAASKFSGGVAPPYNFITV